MKYFWVVLHFTEGIGAQKILVLHSGHVLRNERYSLFFCETWSGYLFPEDLQRLEKGEGRYKFVSPFRAYDERNRMRPGVIYIELRGDIIKVQILLVRGCMKNNSFFRFLNC
uniref:Uncharacterized protein n=1 Tax=Glossina palpalis gambiensis TaxID=67801 RepID=A0A1B0C6H7_9MUSC